MNNSRFLILKFLLDTVSAGQTGQIQHLKFYIFFQVSVDLMKLYHNAV